MIRTKKPAKIEKHEILDAYVEQHLDSPPFGLPDLVIPAEVLLHPGLNSDEKLLFALLENITSNQYGCTEASNGDLGYDLGIKKHKISKALSTLQTKGFIKLEYTKTKQSEEDTSTFPAMNRKIFIDKTYHVKYSRGGA